MVVGKELRVRQLKEKKQQGLFKPAGDFIFLTHTATASSVSCFSEVGHDANNSPFDGVQQLNVSNLSAFALPSFTFARYKSGPYDVTEEPATKLMPPRVRMVFALRLQPPRFSTLQSQRHLMVC